MTRGIYRCRETRGSRPASAYSFCRRAEPLFTFQFLSGDALDHVQKLLCDEAFEFAKGLLLKNRSYFLPFFGRALLQYQLSNLMKQRRRRVFEISLQLFPSL